MKNEAQKLQYKLERIELVSALYRVLTKEAVEYINAPLFLPPPLLIINTVGKSRYWRNKIRKFIKEYKNA